MGNIIWTHSCVFILSCISKLMLMVILPQIWDYFSHPSCRRGDPGLVRGALLHGNISWPKNQYFGILTQKGFFFNFTDIWIFWKFLELSDLCSWPLFMIRWKKIEPTWTKAEHDLVFLVPWLDIWLEPCCDDIGGCYLENYTQPTKLICFKSLSNETNETMKAPSSSFLLSSLPSISGALPFFSLQWRYEGVGGLQPSQVWFKSPPTLVWDASSPLAEEK